MFHGEMQQMYRQGNDFARALPSLTLNFLGLLCFEAEGKQYTERNRGHSGLFKQKGGKMEAGECFMLSMSEESFVTVEPLIVITTALH